MAPFGRALTAVSFEPTTYGDLEELVAIRIAAMRESLERLGRFDPMRARARLADDFDPDVTQIICFEGMRVGFFVFRLFDDEFLLDHLYVYPDFQGLGIGSAVMSELTRTADQDGKQIRVGALKESQANLFYIRHGFQEVGQSEWDVFYVRPSLP